MAAQQYQQKQQPRKQSEREELKRMTSARRREQAKAAISSALHLTKVKNRKVIKDGIADALTANQIK